VARSLSTESNRPDNSRLAIALATKQSSGSGSIGAQRALRGRSRLGELDSGPPRARPRRRREARSGPERSVASRRSRSLETPIRSPAHASFGTIPALSTPGTAATADTLQFVPKRQRCGLAADFRFDRIACKEPVSARGPTCSSSAHRGTVRLRADRLVRASNEVQNPEDARLHGEACARARPSGRVLVGDRGRLVNRSPSTPWAFFDRASDAWQRWTRRARYSRRTLGTGVATPSDRKATLTSRATGV
jgi:hypothetical protein